MDPEEFIDEAAAADLICSICTLVHANPATMGCREGHAFCAECITVALAVSNLCPVCREEPATPAVYKSGPLR